MEIKQLWRFGDDVIDLKKGYEENSNYSSPSFHYILKDVVFEDN